MKRNAQAAKDPTRFALMRGRRDHLGQHGTSRVVAMFSPAAVRTMALATVAFLSAFSCTEIPLETNPSCTVDGMVCVAGAAIHCRADGTAISTDDCLARGHYCDAERGCVECTAFGQDQCLGEELVSCSPEGVVTSRRDCFVEGLVCAGSALGCAVCRPGSGSCNGNVPQVCNASGTGWDPGAACGPGTQCDVNDGRCKDLCADAVANRSYIGCEYWATSTANAVDLELEYAVVISNPQSVGATVTITNGAESQTYSVGPGELETVRLGWLAPVRPYREVTDGVYEAASILDATGAYHIASSVPVTVYQFNPLEYRIDRDCEGETAAADGRCFSHSNDASLLLPTHVLTGEYIVVSRATQRQKIEAFDGAGRRLVFADEESERHSTARGFVAIVGAGDGPVRVTVTSTAHTAGGAGIAPMGPGESQTFELQPGAVVELVTGAPPEASCAGAREEQETQCPAGATAPCSLRVTYCEIDRAYDLTGTRIHADGPVAVFGGHECAFVPDDRFACDHLEESLFPLSAWGTRVVASVTRPLREEPNVFRVVSGSDGNEISFRPEVLAAVTLRSGEFVELEAREDFEVISTGPIAVGQFLVGQEYAGLGTTAPEERGDPSFSLGIPVEQYRTSYSFLAPETFQESWVNVTAPIGRAVLIDGTRVGGWQPVAGSHYQTARVRIGGGPHRMTSLDPFGVSVYGFGSYTSYMYPAGLDLRVINLN